MPHVRIQGMKTENKLDCHDNLPATFNIAVIAAGRRHNKTVPTTNTVVLSALFSLANLATSSCSSC